MAHFLHQEGNFQVKGTKVKFILDSATLNNGDALVYESLAKRLRTMAQQGGDGNPSRAGLTTDLKNSL